MGQQKLSDNLNSLLSTLVRLKPSTAKGTYIRGVAVSSTMGPGIKIDPADASGPLVSTINDSLALTLYGDLDLSVIDELPPGRTPITTVVRSEADREKVYAGIRKEIARGHQVYVVVPLVEETEKSDLKAATAFAAHLQEEVFPDLTVGLLHGKMKSDEKERTMARFTSGELHVLVATTVVEVGVDVPNASVMIVEHAERFGLAQPHQLRGRVGRGAARSYCVLMVGEGEGFGVARERLEIMTETNDGFRISERDLQIRGPGAVFGTQQHGMTDLQFLADVLRDARLLETARDEAKLLVNLEGDAGAETLVHARTYGEAEAPRRYRRWRIFFLACEELFGYRGGAEWFVAHYRFAKAEAAPTAGAAGRSAP